MITTIIIIALIVAANLPGWPAVGALAVAGTLAVALAFVP